MQVIHQKAKHTNNKCVCARKLQNINSRNDRSNRRNSWAGVAQWLNIYP